MSHGDRWCYLTLRGGFLQADFNLLSLFLSLLSSSQIQQNGPRVDSEIRHVTPSDSAGRTLNGCTWTITEDVLYHLCQKNRWTIFWLFLPLFFFLFIFFPLPRKPRSWNRDCVTQPSRSLFFRSQKGDGPAKRYRAAADEILRAATTVITIKLSIRYRYT